MECVSVQEKLVPKKTNIHISLIFENKLIVVDNHLHGQITACKDKDNRAHFSEIKMPHLLVYHLCHIVGVLHLQRQVCFA